MLRSYERCSFFLITFPLQDYLSASTDLQEVLQLDPNVQEAEQELEQVTVLLRESLMSSATQGERTAQPVHAPASSKRIKAPVCT